VSRRVGSFATAGRFTRYFVQLNTGEPAQAIYVLPQRISFIWDVTIYRTDLKSGTAQFCVWRLPWAEVDTAKCRLPFARLSLNSVRGDYVSNILPGLLLKAAPKTPRSAHRFTESSTQGLPTKGETPYPLPERAIPTLARNR
jgi:hypothetical protein